jgi:hypothetical protein
MSHLEYVFVDFIELHLHFQSAIRILKSAFLLNTPFRKIIFSKSREMCLVLPQDNIFADLQSFADF